MAENIGTKFGRELNSFFYFVIINVVFSGLAMGLSISFAILNILAVADGIMKGVLFNWGSVPLWISPQVFLAALGVIAAGFSMRWLIYSSQMLADADGFKKEYLKSQQLSDGLTSLIMRAMAYYRAKKTTIQMLVLVCRVGGICFLISAGLQILNGFLVLSAAFDPFLLAGIVASVLASAAVGVAGLILPRYFSSYSSTWDYRLKEGEKAEEELRKMMGGSE